jgi:metal-responsive CopG/Arc/MetJ family transcriptional regulator
MAPLIDSKTVAEEKVQFRIRLRKNLFNEMNSYCKWAGIKKRDHFIEQALQYIFQHDYEWLEHIQTTLSKDVKLIDKVEESNNASN